MKNLLLKLLTKNNVASILLLISMLLIPDKNFINVPSDEIKQLLFFILCLQGMKEGADKVTFK
ncbi:hypothetical protein SKA34_21830 [Photobacterium sp. SKA34]|uniref:hypothetical protein n=1 Tax=Photobacterium sp. SKA34 TaxID=121723 RepID=UPI00006B1366|nr:hypothetical protein [Photobacterium sp. SKA34]EAR54732.1 hypothetical protein SKA34_21830 [Photobacterium sp. SKA34]